MRGREWQSEEQLPGNWRLGFRCRLTKEKRGYHHHDADYVSKYTLGFEQLREKVKEYPPERVEQWTGIAASDIRKLAREYAKVRPAVIRLNYGVQRSEGGGMATRAVVMLPCITGSWKEVGGGLQMSVSGAADFNSNALKRPDLMRTSLGREARTINMFQGVQSTR